MSDNGVRKSFKFAIDHWLLVWNCSIFQNESIIEIFRGLVLSESALFSEINTAGGGYLFALWAFMYTPTPEQGSAIFTIDLTNDKPQRMRQSKAHNFHICLFLRHAKGFHTKEKQFSYKPWTPWRLHPYQICMPLTRSAERARRTAPMRLSSWE